MKNKLKNLLITGLLLAGISSYAQNNTAEELINKHLNVKGIVFNETVSSSLMGEFPPNTINDIQGRDFESFSYRLRNGKVCRLDKTYSFLSEESAKRKQTALKPIYEKLLSHYSGVPVGNIKWEDGERSTPAERGTISASAGKFNISLLILQLPRSYILGAIFTVRE